jgi:ATP-dependent DNA ligase
MDLGFAAHFAYLIHPPMQNLTFPSGATPSALPTTIPLAIASSSVRPLEGDDWLHEVKYDGHRILAVLDGRDGLKLMARGPGFTMTAIWASRSASSGYR